MQVRIKCRNWFACGCGQLSTPYLTIFWDHGTICVGLGIVVGEIQLWVGQLEDLI